MQYELERTISYVDACGLKDLAPVSALCRLDITLVVWPGWRNCMSRGHCHLIRLNMGQFHESRGPQRRIQDSPQTSFLLMEVATNIRNAVPPSHSFDIRKGGVGPVPEVSHAQTRCQHCNGSRRSFGSTIAGSNTAIVTPRGEGGPDGLQCGLQCCVYRGQSLPSL